MEVLDYKYIAKLVSRAQLGDSDAFAELYAATYKRQYLYAYRYLKDEYLAQDALQETYILALKHLADLKDPTLVISWLNQINFRVCYNLYKKQIRYNSEMGVEGDAIFNSDLNTGGGYWIPRFPGAFHHSGRIRRIPHESDSETSFYRITGYFDEILPEFKTG